MIIFSNAIPKFSQYFLFVSIKIEHSLLTYSGIPPHLEATIGFPLTSASIRTNGAESSTCDGIAITSAKE